MRVRFFFILFSLLFFQFSFEAFAQDVAWFEGMFRAGNNSSFKKSLDKNLEEMAIAHRDKAFAEEARLLTESGLLYLTGGHDEEQAMSFMIKAMALEDSIKLETQKVYTYMAIARVFESVGDNYKCEQFLKEALTLSRKINDISTNVFILNDLGRINVLMGHLDDAFENYTEVIKDTEEPDQRAVHSDALFNLAHLHTIEKKYHQALDEHKAALTVRRALHNRELEATSLNDIGELYLLLKNEKKSIANLVAGLEIRQSLRDKRGIAGSYNNLGVMYYQEKNFDRAIANLQLGLKSARESQSQEQIMKSYEYLSLCFKAKKNYQKAFEFKELYSTMADFIFTEKSERKLAEMQNRYVISTNESKINQLEAIRLQREKEIEVQKKLQNFLMIMFALGILLAVVIFVFYLSKRKSNQTLQIINEKMNVQNLQLQELNATKDKFFSIIGHDVKGPLNSLSSFSGLLINHSDSLSKEEIKMLATDLDKSLKNLFALLENLLEWSRSQTGNIEFKAEPFDINAVLKSSADLLSNQAQQKNISIVQQTTAQLTVSADANSVNTVVRNLISNAIKFTPAGGSVVLSSTQTDQEVVVSVRDTGVGMSESVINKLFRIDTKHSTKGTANEKGTGLGLILSKEFIEKNGGKIWVESEEGKGSVFRFSLPK